jgi:SAM-dependent methyltransferase
MKTRESGMPEEEVWEGFFKPEAVLRSLGLRPEMRRVVEFGSGYGTFCLPAARMIRGEVIGLDIEPDLVHLCRGKAERAGLINARFECRDFILEGTGLDEATASFVMLFNILHAEKPETLLREARRILVPDGVLAVMHWNYDEQTPRGPSMAIRPDPVDCRKWVVGNGFEAISPIIPLPPWHYGFTAEPSGLGRTWKA